MGQQGWDGEGGKAGGEGREWMEGEGSERGKEDGRMEQWHGGSVSVNDNSPPKNPQKAKGEG